jgi:hypothetical protein
MLAFGALGPMTPTLLHEHGWAAVLPSGRAYWTVLARNLHLPPSAVSLVSDVRFRRSA